VSDCRGSVGGVSGGTGHSGGQRKNQQDLRPSLKGKVTVPPLYNASAQAAFDEACLLDPTLIRP
jgi:hypothetical protein